MFFYAIFSVESGRRYSMAFNYSFNMNRYYAPLLSTFGLRTVDRRDEDDVLFYVSANQECSINIAPMQDDIICIDERHVGQSRVLQKLQ